MTCGYLRRQYAEGREDEVKQVEVGDEDRYGLAEMIAMELPGRTQTRVPEAGILPHIMPSLSARTNGHTPVRPRKSIVLLFGDVHYGAHFKGDDLFQAYGSDIADVRINRLFDAVIETAESEGITDIHVIMMGDMIDGTHLRIQHARETDSHAIDQVMGISSIIIDNLLKMMDVGLEITVVGVPGNHARLQAKPGSGDPAESLDTLTYRMVVNAIRRMPGRKIRENISKSWYVIHSVRGWNFLVVHGENVRAGVNFIKSVHAAANKYVQAINAAALRGNMAANTVIHHAVFGHFHVPGHLDYGDIEVWVNGAVQSGSEYTAKNLVAAPNPSQTLMIVDEDEGVISYRKIRLF